MRRLVQIGVVLVSVGVVASPITYAQVATGSITGTIRDASGSILPGVTISVSGERLIGGVQERVSDGEGTFRFDRLPPGAYALKAVLQGFRSFEQRDIRISASFVATINIQMEVGALEETLTVQGQSPTVDTKSTVQQVVMNQDILEGVPTGRDPWSVAKIIPGVQVNVYDVGGTQAMQASFLSAHGSQGQTLQIDGSTVNWPGGSGGATMIYYDQGMFEEVNFQTSAMPAEVAVEGIYLNMISKEAGNTWRGNMKSFYSNRDWQANNSDTEELTRLGFQGGNPVTKMYDFNLSGGGPLIGDKLWLTGSYRNWRVDKLSLGARNADGTPAIDDNLIWNTSTKLVWQPARSQKISYSYNYNWKERFHRRDGGFFAEDKASYHQTNPAFTTQLRYSAVRSKAVFESTFGLMDGVTNYFYQDDVKPTDIRIVDSVRNTASGAAQWHRELPNYRLQIDNTFSYAAMGLGGDHLLKAGVQYVRMGMLDQYWINGDQYILFNDGAPNAVQIWNTPASNDSKIQHVGLFAQDAWTIARNLTLNLGVRFDTAKGWMPAQSNPAGTFIGERTLERRDAFDHSRAVLRTGVVYDVGGKGRTALKANFSQYAQQLGLDRVQTVHPFQPTSGTRAWTDSNGDRIPQPQELGTFSGFSGLRNRYPDDGLDWPYSNEITAGIEHQLVSNVRFGVMYYRRESRKQIGFRNAAAPRSAYTAVPVTIPGAPAGPGGNATFYDLDRAFFGQQFLDNVYDNEDLFDRTYNGIELTAAKRFSQRWQVLGGLTIGKNRGGTASGDLNDPNNSEIFPTGIVGNDSTYSFKLSGTYVAPGDVTIAGGAIMNEGQPYVSTYRVTRSIYPGLTRSGQTINLAERGTERLSKVTMLDLRFSRPFVLGGGRRVTPLVELFNITNASTVVRNTSAVGSRYLAPAEILAPRIVRAGVTVDF